MKQTVLKVFEKRTEERKDEGKKGTKETKEEGKKDDEVRKHEGVLSERKFSFCSDR